MLSSATPSDHVRDHDGCRSAVDVGPGSALGTLRAASSPVVARRCTSAAPSVSRKISRMYSPMIPRLMSWIEPMNRTTTIVLAQPRGPVRAGRRRRPGPRPSARAPAPRDAEAQVGDQPERVAAEADQAVDGQRDQRPEACTSAAPPRAPPARRPGRSGGSRRTSAGRGRTASARAGRRSASTTWRSIRQKSPLSSGMSRSLIALRSR